MTRYDVGGRLVPDLILDVHNRTIANFTSTTNVKYLHMTP